jgi:hypothetical protein
MSKSQTRKISRKLPEPQKPAKPQLNLWPPIAGLAILVYGLYRAIDLRWISDDAFITMRYVKNFVEGNGLVYNVGERVEGYTHFLWLMVLAASKAIGFDPVDASMWLGIAAYAGILILLLAISLREYKKNPNRIWLPIAAALFALNYDTAEWASGGLETSFYTLLVLGAFYLWFYSRFSEQRRLLLTGITLMLISLTRPDGVLFTATAVVLLTVMGLRNKQSILSLSKNIGILVLPSIVIGIPYLIWKYNYYGDILPLTYYAKSADENYFNQGFFYIWLYFRVHFTSAIALIVSSFVLLRKNPNGKTSNDESYRGSPSTASLTAIVIYLILFVARVGGDFMFARFIIPVVPFVYFVIERAMERLPLNMLRARIAIAVLLVFSIFLENYSRKGALFHLNADGNQVQNYDLPPTLDGSTRGIADERWTYYYHHFVFGDIHRGSLDVYSEIAQYLEPFFHDLPITVAIPGAANMVAYYANFPVSINEYGLTDSYIGHLPITGRGRIGHEKKAPEDYLIKRNVDFEWDVVVSKLPEHLDYNTIAFQIPDLGLWQLAREVTYNKTVMDELDRRFTLSGNQSKIPLLENIISYYVEHTMSTRSLDVLQDDYTRCRTDYFNRYPDTALSNRFEERIAELKQDSARAK